jgi:hypothetical protein
MNRRADRVARSRRDTGLVVPIDGRGTPAGMQLAGKMTMHQVHPAKIGTDVTASVVSNTLVRQGG